jgi:hypothetical protein
VTRRRTRRLSKHESVYGDAIDELGNQLRNDQAFEAAKDWAIDFCKKVQQKDRPRRRQRIPVGYTWDGGSSAAHKLATYLEHSADDIVTGRLFAAAKKSGVALEPDPPVRWGLATAAEALRKFLRELSEQEESHLQQRCQTLPSRYVPDEMTWYVRSPLAVGFCPNQNIVMPHRPLALAVGLTHGFRVITASHYPREEINRLNHVDALSEGADARAVRPLRSSPTQRFLGTGRRVPKQSRSTSTVILSNSGGLGTTSAANKSTLSLPHHKLL